MERVAVRRDRGTRRVRRLGVIVAAAVAVAAAVGITALVNPNKVKPLAEAAGIGRPHRLLPTVTPAVVSLNYAILNTGSAGDPVTYDPCKPIHYAINRDGAPANYLNFIQPAIQRAQAATGLEFVYDGLSTQTWSSHQAATKPGPVLISFPTTLDSPKANGDTVGLGGSTWIKSNTGISPHYLTGQIALLRHWFGMESAQNDSEAERAVVMHELGHVLGLGHVQDPQQIMYPESHGQTTYGAGDLTGLAKLGAGKCAW
jgi:hypothetical protein